MAEQKAREREQEEKMEDEDSSGYEDRNGKKIKEIREMEKR